MAESVNELSPNSGASPDFSRRVTEAATNISSQVTEKITNAATSVGGRVVSSLEQAKGLLAPKDSQGEGETNFVSVESENDVIKRKNLYYVSASIGFVWMLFHFTVVYFFGIELGSAALVGIFLWFGNLVSLALDIPVGALQKYFYAKKLYLFAAIAQLAAAVIFLKFIYVSSLFSPGSGGEITTLLENFLDQGTNLIFLVLAAIFYGFTKEINDITTLSYILNNADPSEYSSIISRNNIFAGGGSLLGLVASGFILALNPTAAVLVLITFILLLIAFVVSYFDNSERTIDFSAITKLKIVAQKPNVEKLKEYAVGYVSKTDFAILAKSTKFVFLRPMGEKAAFDPKKIAQESKNEAVAIKKVIMDPPFHFGMFWAGMTVLTFGFWDTFATSFLIEYLAKLSSPQMAYVMLAIIAIPAFIAQSPFIQLSKRIGNLPVVVFGIILSGVSLVCMSGVSSVPAFIVLGIANSLGYAAGMGIAQWAFLDRYNAFYAKKFHLTEIDSNASASPMKIIQNLANVVGLLFGGLLLALFGFSGFFVAFGLLLTFGAFVSLYYRKKIAE